MHRHVQPDIDRPRQCLQQKIRGLPPPPAEGLTARRSIPYFLSPLGWETTLKRTVALVFVVVASCGGGPTGITAPTQVPPLPTTSSFDVAGRVVNLFGQAVAGARVTI